MPVWVWLHGGAVMSYVYVKSEADLWTVGFYDPSGKWQPESDHGNRDSAAARVAWLNGSVDPVATARAIVEARIERPVECHWQPVEGSPLAALSVGEICARFYKDL
jgi:hypothetical protein